LEFHSGRQMAMVFVSKEDLMVMCSVNPACKKAKQ
jgi:hypothetical protein